MARLSNEEIVELARMARAGDAKSRDILVDSHMGLGVQMASRVRRRLNFVREVLMDGDDFVQEAWAGLIRAVDSFDPDRNDDPRGYYSVAMYGSIIDAVRRIYGDNKRQRTSTAFDDVPSLRGGLEGVERRDYIDWMESHLPDSQRAVIRLRYRDGHPPDVVAQRLKISRATVYASGSRAIDRMGNIARSTPDSAAALADLAGW